MQPVPDWHWVTWNGGDFSGPNRPITRAAIQRGVVSSTAYQTGASTLPWRSILFNQNTDKEWKEIPNIVNCTIDRRLGSDAAVMSLRFRNQIPVSPSTNLDLTHANQTPGGTSGPSRRQLKDLGFPGYYTYNRGTTPYSAGRWGHPMDPEWMDEFIPNRVIATFQGYGTSGAGKPWDDTNLSMTGLWLIDRVTYEAGGSVQVECRDFGKLLIEQRLYPPIIPLDEYPLTLQIDHTETVIETQTIYYDPYTVEVPGEEIESPNLGRYPAWSYNSSNAYYYSDKQAGAPCAHKTQYAFDGDWSTYWLSIANNSGTASYAYEWIEIDTQGYWCERIKINQKWGNYKIYVSIYQDGAWIGQSIIPYNPAGVGINQSNIPYVEGPFQSPAGDGWYVINLGFAYRSDKIRLTFTNLYRTDSCASSLSTPHRVAINEITVHNVTVSTSYESRQNVGEEEVATEVFVPGNIRDYTDVVKLFCAWAGFYWPDAGSTDWVIENWSNLAGRIWGDFEYSGAYPTEPPVIDPSYWDNKSLMDGINQIKEILGFIFYIDATGAVVWRTPNIWTKGNFLTGRGYQRGEGYIETVDEDRVLLDYGVTLDDSQLRSEVIVVAAPSPDESVSVEPGWAVFRPGGSSAETTPEAGTFSDLRLLGGQERVTIIPDYPFISQDEIRKFGYLVTLWMHWSFRKSRFRIPGIAAFEPDDQIRIFERTTSESFIHYITGISSSMDMDKGTWYMDVDTHWLGEGPGSTWVIDYADMAEASPALFAYLTKGTGRLDEEDFVALGDEFFQYAGPTLADGSPVYVDPRDIIDPIADMFPPLPDIAPANPDIESEGPSSGPGSSSNPERGSYTWSSTFWGTAGGAACRTPHLWIPSGAHVNQPESVNITTHSKAISSGALRAFRIVIEDLELRIYDNITTCYNYRSATNSSNLSNHSWGIAFDVNANLNSGWKYYHRNGSVWNNQGGSSVGSSPPPPDPDAQALANALSSRVRLGATSQRIFRWGGDWTNTKDYMHFELQVTPEELSSPGVYLDGVPIGNYSVIPGAE